MKQKKVLYIAVGAPNSGKTSLINFRCEAFGGVHISRDKIRFALLKPEDNYFAHEKEVFTSFVNEIQKALDDEEGSEFVYADATHLNKTSRSKLIRNLKLDNVEKIVILRFQVPLETLLERNETREGLEKIAPSAIERMYYSLDNVSQDKNPMYEIWYINKDWEIRDYDFLN